MLNTSLRSTLDALASTFANSVLQGIRSASLEDLQAESGVPRRGGTGSGKPGARKTRSGRLARRSAEDIAKAVAGVVALVKKIKDGLRAEQIRKALKLDVRDRRRHQEAQGQGAKGGRRRTPRDEPRG